MRMMESLISLTQMTRTTLAINELKKNGLPYIVCITDPTAGGITASYAMLGDIQIAEPGALIAFAGSRVIQGTVKEELPEGFQKSEYVEKTGFVDLIVERKELTSKIGTLLSIVPEATIIPHSSPVFFRALFNLALYDLESVQFNGSSFGIGVLNIS